MELPENKPYTVDFYKLKFSEYQEEFVLIAEDCIEDSDEEKEKHTTALNTPQKLLHQANINSTNHHKLKSLLNCHGWLLGDKQKCVSDIKIRNFTNTPAQN